MNIHFFLKYSLLAAVLFTSSQLMATPVSVSSSILAERPSTLILNKSNNGVTRKVCVGDIVQVELSLNKGTGYTWVQSVSVPEVLQFQSSSDCNDSDNENLLGAQVTHVFTFKATNPGQTTLSCDLERPWEEEPAPEKHVSFTIIVEPDAPAL